ncbi:mitochondrial inner membrane protease subunit 2 isoform X5 [Hyperolius riggenbachi]|uniref:mitochondrial inner membrane protease subunit 2 isoform X5 n=1 Tax=Hyperolius riggenbachi TaxID=752182 RepID=UPI0035A3148B
MARFHGRRYIRAFVSGFFVAVPVTVTFFDRVACIARVDGISMQPSLNPSGKNESDVVLLNRWKMRNYEVQRGDIVSLVSGTRLSARPQYNRNRAVGREESCKRSETNLTVVTAFGL